MHYLPKLLNEKKIFQRLHNFMQSTKDNQEFVVSIEHFLYRATSVLISLDRMFHAEGQSVNLVNSYIKQIKFGDDSKIALSAEPLFEVYNQIPIALSQLVNMQNHILVILQKAFEVKSSSIEIIGFIIRRHQVKWNH